MGRGQIVLGPFLFGTLARNGTVIKTWQSNPIQEMDKSIQRDWFKLDLMTLLPPMWLEQVLTELDLDLDGSEPDDDRRLGFI